MTAVALLIGVFMGAALFMPTVWLAVRELNTARKRELLDRLERTQQANRLFAAMTPPSCVYGDDILETRPALPKPSRRFHLMGFEDTDRPEIPDTDWL